MVQYISDKTGRFPSRPFYRQEELDNECEQVITTFLSSIHGAVEFPISTEDIIRLIEKRVSDLDSYADLSEFGEDVEGLTEFYSGSHPTVKISSRLTEDEHRENRLRTTLTHEFGHVHFHKPLFESLEDQLILSFVDPKQNIIACKRDGMLNAPSYDWLEWQAGYACGAFLMPKSHLVKYVAEFSDEMTTLYPLDRTGKPCRELIMLVAEKFQVSREAARVRLSQLKYIGTQQNPKPLFS